MPSGNGDRAWGQPPGPEDIRARRTITGRGGGGYAPTMPGAPSAGPSLSGRGLGTAQVGISVPPPHEIPPPNHYGIRVDTFGTGFNNANTPGVIPGSAFTVPAGYTGVIRSYTLNVNNLTAVIAPAWTLRFNTSPVNGWAGLSIFPRAAASVAVNYGPGETFIIVPPETTIDVLFTVGPADANTYQAGVAYSGWYAETTVFEMFARAYLPQGSGA